MFDENLNEANIPSFLKNQDNVIRRLIYSEILLCEVLYFPRQKLKKCVCVAHGREPYFNLCAVRSKPTNNACDFESHPSYTYSMSGNEAPPISGVLIGRHLILHSLTSPPCCDSPRKCMPVKYKKRQKAGFPIAT